MADLESTKMYTISAYVNATRVVSFYYDISSIGFVPDELIINNVIYNSLSLGDVRNYVVVCNITSTPICVFSSAQTTVSTTVQCYATTPHTRINMQNKYIEKNIQFTLYTTPDNVGANAMSNDATLPNLIPLFITQLASTLTIQMQFNKYKKRKLII